MRYFCITVNRSSRAYTYALTLNRTAAALPNPGKRLRCAPLIRLAGIRAAHSHGLRPTELLVLAFHYLVVIMDIATTSSQRVLLEALVASRTALGEYLVKVPGSPPATVLALHPVAWFMVVHVASFLSSSRRSFRYLTVLVSLGYEPI